MDHEELKRKTLETVGAMNSADVGESLRKGVIRHVSGRTYEILDPDAFAASGLQELVSGVEVPGNQEKPARVTLRRTPTRWRGAI